MIDFIHIGDYKTGTSWLQKFYYPRHPSIHYLGGPFQNDQLEHLLHKLIDSRDLDFDALSIRDEIQKHILKDEVRSHGICREVFCATNFITGENAKQNAERLLSVFGPVKIIFVIREQFSMLASIYSQYLKMGGTLSLRKFIFDPIICKGLIERLKWHKPVGMYYSIFGKQNVHVKLYEQFKNTKQTFLDDISNFLQIPSFHPEETNQTVNKSLSKVGHTFLDVLIMHFAVCTTLPAKFCHSIS